MLSSPHVKMAIRFPLSFVPLRALMIFTLLIIANGAAVSPKSPLSTTKDPFCCFCSSDKADMCESCRSKSKVGGWCSGSADNCDACHGMWCSDAFLKSNSPAESDEAIPDDLVADENNSEDHNRAAKDILKNMPTTLTTQKKNAGNPFEGHELYINPSFVEHISKTITKTAPGVARKNLLAMRAVASAYWLDVKTKVDPDQDDATDTAAGILKDAASKPAPPVVTLVVYNLPNRDCAAKASNGKVCCGATKPEGNCDYLGSAAAGTCDYGLAEYMHEYIDKLAVSVKKFCWKVPMVFVIEPDSLPNLATNADDPKCGSQATKTTYRYGIAYAVNSLAQACPASSLYLDAAHGGWLGWPDSLKKFTEEVKALGISQHLRGFSTNVANYQPLGVRCPTVGYCLNSQHKDHECCKDPCGLSAEWNIGHSELNYVSALSESMTKAIPGFFPKFIIDTGRNARSPRAKCANWCNIRGAGAGLKPTYRTSAPALVDAYHWLKTPGESDGCTKMLPNRSQCPRFDENCASPDSIGTKPGEPRAPGAGGWFEYQAKMLAQNAIMG